MPTPSEEIIVARVKRLLPLAPNQEDFERVYAEVAKLVGVSSERVQETWEKR